ncbi:hypothetical protein MD484_g7238, partial [Candolleomyces efflorescens]
MRLILTHPRLLKNATHADIQLCLQRAAELGAETTVKAIISEILAPETLRPDFPVLLEATKAGQLSIVEMLLEYADVNAADDFGRTALAEAATRGYLDIATLLLSREDILVNKGSHPPLITASRRGYSSIVQLLLHHHDIDVNVQDADGQVSLAWAIDAEHWDVADILLAMPTIDVNRGTCPALIKACSKGHENLVERLLEREGIDVNVEDAKGWSPLTCAAFIGHESICSSLLGRPELKLAGRSVSPFVQAAAGGSEAVVRLLLSRIPIHSLNDVDVDGGNAVTALSIAARHGFSEIVELLVCKPEVDVNLGRPTPLMQASIGGHVGIVRLLLSHCAEALNVNVRDEHHSFATALWYACYSRKGRSAEIVQLLLERPDLDVNIGLEPNPLRVNDEPPLGSFDEYDMWQLSTPLHAACIRRPRAAQILCAAPGIDVNNMNAHDKTALMVVLDRDPTSKAVDYLLSCPESQNSAHLLKLLVYAAGLAGLSPSEERSIVDVMEKLLLNHQTVPVDINEPEPSTGLTALSAAVRGNSAAAVSYLLSLPAIDPNCGIPLPVIQAAIFGNVTVLEMLLRHPKTDPNVKSESGYTALGEACIPSLSFVPQSTIELLVSWPGVKVNAGKHTPLAIAVLYRSLHLALLLRSPNTDVNCRVPRPSRDFSTGPLALAMDALTPDQNGEGSISPASEQLEWRELCSAISSYHGTETCLGEQHAINVAHDPLYANVGRILYGPPPQLLDACDGACDPILVYCTKFRLQQVADMLLLRDGIDVNATGDCGCTALTWASQRRMETTVNMLLDRDDTTVDVRCVQHGHTALLAAAHQMCFQSVHKLLTHPRSHEINANAFAACGCNVFVSASRSGDEDTVQSILSLVDWREYPNAQDCKFGRTALLWASYFGHNSLVQLFLCQEEVSVDHRDRQGHTALMLAASGGHEDVVRSLLSSSRINNVHVCDRNGDTALSLAEWYGHKNLVKLLELRKDPVEFEVDGGRIYERICPGSFHLALMTVPETQDFIVFGYGSLIFKDAFPDDDVVWGVAYTIDPAYVAEVRDYLDYREKDGYTMETLDVYGLDERGNSIVTIHNVRCNFYFTGSYLAMLISLN